MKIACGNDYDYVGSGESITVSFEPDLYNQGYTYLQYYFVRAEGGSDVPTTCQEQLVIPKPKPNISSVNVTCNGNTATVEILPSSNANEYSIDGGDTFQSSNTFTNVANVMDTVVVRNKDTGCIDWLCSTSIAAAVKRKSPSPPPCKSPPTLWRRNQHFVPNRMG